MFIRQVGPGQDDAWPWRPVRVVLVDNDPLSRQFLLSALGALAKVEVRALRFEDVPKDGDQHVVIVASTPDLPARLTQLRKLTAAGERVLVLGVEWTQRSIRDALESGAAGVMVKTTDIAGLAAALSAVASGHVVISPELLAVYLGAQPSALPPDPVEPDHPEPTAEPTAEALRLLGVLTSREIEVLGLVAEGLSTVEAADRLGVSLATIKSHVSHVLTKLGVRNRVQAVLIANKLRLVELAARYRRVAGGMNSIR